MKKGVEMNRIDRKFQELKGQSAFIPYICAGDPNISTTNRLVHALEAAGADIVELGVPFSDPIADGPSIQKASERALKHKISLGQIIDTVRKLRRTTQIPIALMTYYNPVFAYGVADFCKTATEAGVDGVIVPDLPPEEAEELFQAASKHGLAVILLVAPTSPEERMKLISKVSTGFVYLVSVTGVTGARGTLSEFIQPMLNKLRQFTDKPLGVGFGVSTPEQAQTVAQMADAVIIGSAIINVIEANLRDEEKLLEEVQKFAGSLAKAVKQKTE